MAKRETKRNGGTSFARRGFKIRQHPSVALGENTPLPEVPDPIGAIGINAHPFLFAIARDARTIFASWNISWRSVFENTMPADRKVHLRLIGGVDVIETTVAVEPMSAMHYVTTSGLHDSYRVDIGFFQPIDTWHSLATSSEVKMPPHRTVDLGDVDLATIPFHLGFQQLANLFRAGNDAPVAKLVSQFQKRLTREQPNEALSSDTQILDSLNLSQPEIAGAQRNFRNIDTEKLAQRAHAMLLMAWNQSSTSIHSEVTST